MAIKEIVLMKTLQQNGNNRNRVDETLTILLKNENNTSAWRFPFFYLLYAPSILLHFSSIAALFITFQILYNVWLCAQEVTKRF
jgi:hypothetical protein